MAWNDSRKIDTGFFTSMNSSKAQYGSKLPGVVLGAAIIGLCLAPLPATAGESISTISQKIEAALEAASTARAAYTSYYTAATEGCLTFDDNTVDCFISSSELQVSAIETRTVSTLH